MAGRPSGYGTLLYSAQLRWKENSRLGPKSTPEKDARFEADPQFQTADVKDFTAEGGESAAGPAGRCVTRGQSGRNG